MRTFTEYFSEDKKVSLTANLLDNSPEMGHLDVRPAVLVIPGGAYRFCSDREAEPIAMLFALEGYHTFVLRYSVGERGKDYSFEKPFEDAKRALRYIRENAAEFGVDPEKIAAIGFSAGGHLCSALGTLSEEKPNALILSYPCIMESISEILSCDVPSTNLAVTKDTPPAYIFAAADDGCVPIQHSLAFASACAENGVPFEMHIYQNGGHGFSLANPVVCGGKSNLVLESWAPLCAQWLRKLWL